MIWTQFFPQTSRNVSKPGLNISEHIFSVKLHSIPFLHEWNLIWIFKEQMRHAIQKHETLSVRGWNWFLIRRNFSTPTQRFIFGGKVSSSSLLLQLTSNNERRSNKKKGRWSLLDLFYVSHNNQSDVEQKFCRSIIRSGTSFFPGFLLSCALLKY